MEGNTVSIVSQNAQPMTQYDGTEILYNGTVADLFKYLKKCFGSNETEEAEADWVVIYFSKTESGKIESATWAANKSDNLVGSYPTLADGRSSELYGRAIYYLPNTDSQ